MRTKTKTSNALAALKGMTPKQLRERYAELYGEPSRSGNKQWRVACFDRLGGKAWCSGEHLR